MLVSMLLLLNHWNLLTADSAGSDGVIVKAGKEGSTRLAWWKMMIIVVPFFSFNCLDLPLTCLDLLLCQLYIISQATCFLCDFVKTCQHACFLADFVKNLDQYLFLCWLCQKFGTLPVSWLTLSKIWNTTCFLASSKIICLIISVSNWLCRDRRKNAIATKKAFSSSQKDYETIFSLRTM